MDRAEPKPDEILFDEFCYSLAEVAERVCNPGDASTLFNANYDGILLIIDEADNASKNLPLGLFLKLMLERLDRRGCHRIMIGLAGLDNLPKVLLQGHPSALRMFETLRLNRLSTTEVDQVITICINRANEKNDVKTVITDPARLVLAGLSEGYPHFV